MSVLYRRKRSLEIHCCLSPKNVGFDNGIMLNRGSGSLDLELIIWRLWLVISHSKGIKDAELKDNTQSLPEP